MTWYAIRIELHNANAEDYQTLHDILDVVEIVRTITSDQGTEYQLPTGMYFTESDRNIDEILSLVKNLAAVARPNPEVFVVETSSMKWTGLNVLG